VGKEFVKAEIHNTGLSFPLLSLYYRSFKMNTKTLAYWGRDKLMGKNFWQDKNRILGLATTMAFLISLLHVFLCFDVYDDIAAWYGPMTRAFIAGNWSNAFTPKVPVLNTTFAGMLGLLGLEPFRALVVVSCIFYIATIPVLYVLMKNFFSRDDYAAWCCVLYVLAPKIIRFSCTGLLNSSKNFFIICGLALILASSKKLKWHNSILMGIVLASLALSRAETIVFLPFLVLWYAYFIFRDKKVMLNKRISLMIVHGLVITITFFIAAAPRFYQTYKETGIPVLDARQAGLPAKLLNLKYKANNPDFHVELKYKTRLEETKYPSGWPRIWKGFECFVRGAYEPYLILALLGIFLCWKKKEDRMKYLLLFSIIVINMAVIITIVNSVRYYTISLLMLLPFTFSAIKFLIEKLPEHKFVKPALITGFIVLTIFQVKNGAAKAIEHEYDYEYKTGKWLETNKGKYTSNKSIKIASSQPQYSFWANASWLKICGSRLQFIEQLEQIREADFAVLEDDQKELIEILKEQQDFQLLEQKNPEVFIFVITKGEKN
jgi:hypothetical protein